MFVKDFFVVQNIGLGRILFSLVLVDFSGVETFCQTTESAENCSPGWNVERVPTKIGVAKMSKKKKFLSSIEFFHPPVIKGCFSSVLGWAGN